jgi:hypothetical protein
MPRVILSLIWGRHKNTEIQLVLLAGCLWEIPNIDIPMHAAVHVVVAWPQKHRAIMSTLVFTLSRHTTVELAAMLSMVAHKACDVHHSRSICSEQSKEDAGAHFALKCQVPDPEQFPLESSKMS